MNNEKLIEILKDKEFAMRILAMETAEEVQKAFKEKGLEISLEEIGTLGATINKMIGKSGELSEDELEEISGGHIGYNAASFLASLYHAAIKTDDPSITRGINTVLSPGTVLEEVPEEKRTFSYGDDKYSHTLTKSDIRAMGLGHAIGSVPGHVRHGVQKIIKWAKK